MSAKSGHSSLDNQVSCVLGQILAKCVYLTSSQTCLYGDYRQLRRESESYPPPVGNAVDLGSEALETVKVFALIPLFSKEGLGEI